MYAKKTTGFQTDDYVTVWAFIKEDVYSLITINKQSNNDAQEEVNQEVNLPFTSKMLRRAGKVKQSKIVHF